MPTYRESVLFEAIGVDKAERETKRLDRALRQIVETSKGMQRGADPFAAMTRGASSAQRGLTGVASGLRAVGREADRSRVAIDRMIRAAATGQARAVRVVAAGTDRRNSGYQRSPNGSDGRQRANGRVVTWPPGFADRVTSGRDMTAAEIIRAGRGVAKLERQALDSIAREDAARQKMIDRAARGLSRLSAETARQAAMMPQAPRAFTLAGKPIYDSGLRAAEIDARTRALRGLAKAERDAARAAAGGSGGNGRGGGYGGGFRLPGGGWMGGAASSARGAMTLAIGGNAASRGVEGAAHALADYSAEISRIKIESGKDAASIVPMVERAASDIARLHPQIAKGEAVAKVREQFGVVGDSSHAIDMAKAGAARSVVLKATSPNIHDPSLPLAKAAEQFLGSRMLTEEGREIGNRLQDRWTQVLIAEKGMLQGRDIQNMIAQSGGSLRGKYNLDKPADIDRMLDEVGTKFPLVGAELGGFKTGTMASSMSRAFNGRMTDQAKGMFEQMGLLDPSKIESRNTKGDPHKLGYGAFVGGEKSLFDYATQTLAPALKRSGMYDDAAKRDWAIDQLSSNVVVSRGLKLILNDEERISKGLSNVRKMQSIPEAERTLQGDVSTGKRGVEGSLKTLSQVFLEPLITPVTTLFSAMTTTLQTASASGDGNPFTKLGIDAAGIATLAAGAVVKSIYENPAQAANTTAVGALTAAVIANTGAQRGKSVVDAVTEGAKTTAAAGAGSAIIAGAVTAGVATGGAALATTATNMTGNLASMIDTNAVGNADPSGFSLGVAAMNVERLRSETEKTATSTGNALPKQDAIIAAATESNSWLSQILTAISNSPLGGGAGLGTGGGVEGGIVGGALGRTGRGGFGIGGNGGVASPSDAVPVKIAPGSVAFDTGGVNVRGMKNLNPGNIGYGPYARSLGATGAAGRDDGHGVAVFPTPEAGERALEHLALRKYNGGRKSVYDIIARPGGWTPNRNGPGAAANVARAMGISPHEDARLDDPARMAAFRRGLTAQELGPGGARAWENLRRPKRSLATDLQNGGAWPDNFVSRAKIDVGRPLSLASDRAEAGSDPMSAAREMRSAASDMRAAVSMMPKSFDVKANVERNPNTGRAGGFD